MHAKCGSTPHRESTGGDLLKSACFRAPHLVIERDHAILERPDPLCAVPAGEADEKHAEEHDGGDHGGPAGTIRSVKQLVHVITFGLAFPHSL